MDIVTNKSRIGYFTSSAIGQLMTFAKDGKSFGKPALDYIAEKNMEIRLGRSLNLEMTSKPTSWGSMVERRVFDLLDDMAYTYTPKQTYIHPTIVHWSGSPDGNKLDNSATVYDIKCPATLKSFCQFADCKDIAEIRDNHKSGNLYYWQLVSNAILTDSKIAELIIYVPYKSELDEVRSMAENVDGFTQNDVAWVGFASDDKLPYLLDGGYYKNVNIFRWEVSQSDKDLLTETVIKAGKLLINL